MNKARINPRVLYLTEMSVLLAIILLMAFTPIGYLRTGGLEITFLTVPVAIGAICLGPKAGAFLGTAFGLTSYFLCATGQSVFGSVLFNMSPLRAFLVFVVARFLCGLCTGLVFKAFPKKNALAFGVSGLCGALLNTLFFMTLLVLCYWNTDYLQETATALGSANIFHFILVFVGFNGAVEAVVCTLLNIAVSAPLYKYTNQLMPVAANKKEKSKKED